MLRDGKKTTRSHLTKEIMSLTLKDLSYNLFNKHKFTPGTKNKQKKNRKTIFNSLAEVVVSG